MGCAGSWTSIFLHLWLPLLNNLLSLMEPQGSLISSVFFFFFFLCHNYEKVKSWFYNLTIEIMNSTDVTHSTHQCFFFFWVGYSLSLVCLFLSDIHFLLFYLCPLFRILFLYLYFVCQNELGPFLKVERIPVKYSYIRSLKIIVND